MVETGEIFEKGEPIDMDSLPEDLVSDIENFLDSGEISDRKLN
jgi:hypothetical protein